jgi:hypothetical protein
VGLTLETENKKIFAGLHTVIGASFALVFARNTLTHAQFVTGCAVDRSETGTPVSAHRAPTPLE